jgi:hypothetical protein
MGHLKTVGIPNDEGNPGPDVLGTPPPLPRLTITAEQQAKLDALEWCEERRQAEIRLNWPGEPLSCGIEWFTVKGERYSAMGDTLIEAVARAKEHIEYHGVIDA